MKLNTYLIIVFILNILTEVISKCRKYSCGNLDQGICYSNNAEENKVIIQSCEDSSEFCPFMNNSSDQIACTNREGYHPRSYPGGRCDDNSECISGQCLDQICSGKAQGEACKYPTDCLPGLSCKKTNKEASTCQPQSQENEECETDFDCKNNSGCLDGKCVVYLSYPLGAKIGRSKNLLPICESGLDYQGKCDILTNINYLCSEDDPCKYKLSDGSEVEIKEFCLCGKNPTGSKICRLGNGTPEFSDYLDELRNILKDSSSCNTVERGVCMSHFRSRKDVGKFLLSRVKALKFHELYNSDQCVIDLFFPEIK
jgi:hypothetical protein